MKEVSEVRTTSAGIHQLDAVSRIEAATLRLRKQIEAEFEERIRVLTAQWQAEREKLIQENQELRSLGNGQQPRIATEEIEVTEAALAGLEAQIQALLNDDAAELSMVIQKRAQKSDLEAYLRGLRFRGK